MTNTSTDIIKAEFDLDGIGGFYHSYGFSLLNVEEVEGGTAYRVLGYSDTDYQGALDDAIEQIAQHVEISPEADQAINEAFEAFMKKNDHSDGTYELEQERYQRTADGEEWDWDWDELAMLVTVWISD